MEKVKPEWLRSWPGLCAYVARRVHGEGETGTVEKLAWTTDKVDHAGNIGVEERTSEATHMFNTASAA